MARRSSIARRHASQPAPGTTVARRTGRPTALTENTRDTLLGYLIEGNSIEAACRLTGVHPSTFYNWMSRGEQARIDLDQHGRIPEEEDRFREFFEAAHDARAQAEARAVGVVNKAMHGGFVTSEEPLLDLDGQPLRDDDGKILYKRTYTAPDGRLALAYLQRARPKDWSQQAANIAAKVEVSGPGGGPIEHSVEVAHVDGLAAQLLAVRQQFEEERAEEEGEADIVDADVVEDPDDGR